MTTELAITILIAVVTVAAPILWERRKAKKPKITLEARTFNLINLDSDSKKLIAQKLSVLWEDVQIRRLDITEVVISNSSVAISKDDIYDPVKINFDTANILDVQVISKEPENMNFHYRKEQSSIILDLELLNPGDSITLKAITTGLSDDSKIFGEARIKNGSILNAHLIDESSSFWAKVWVLWENIILMSLVPSGVLIFVWLSGRWTWNFSHMLNFIFSMVQFLLTIVLVAALILFLLIYLPRRFLFRKDY